MNHLLFERLKRTWSRTANLR